MIKVLGTLSARLNSTRLPMKALLPIGGSTMVGHVFDILAASKVDKAVLCTPDAFLANFVNGTVQIWNRERDPLGELFFAAQEHGAEHIVRVTADCPFLTAEIINKMIDAHLAFGSGYTYNHHDYLFSKTPEGIDVEVITFAALLELHNTSTNREHLYTNPTNLKVNRVDMEEEREVFSVNTLEEYFKAYKLIKGN